MQVPFSKYSGCGNDFILIDNRQFAFNTSIPETLRQFWAQLCHRHSGIGADGIILLELPSQRNSQADFRMRIFNADGGEAEMCGNGLCCLACFIQELGISKQSFIIETMHQFLPVLVAGTKITVRMEPATQVQFFHKIQVDKTQYTLHALDTGVPHAVLFVEDLDNDALMPLARKIRHHPNFPKGTNVNFAVVDSKQQIRMRTYERGVEGETLACGTGAAAVAVAAAYLYQLNADITILPKSKEAISIVFENIEKPHLSSFMMTSEPKKLFIPKKLSYTSKTLQHSYK